MLWSMYAMVTRVAPRLAAHSSKASMSFVPDPFSAPGHTYQNSSEAHLPPSNTFSYNRPAIAPFRSNFLCRVRTIPVPACMNSFIFFTHTFARNFIRSFPYRSANRYPISPRVSRSFSVAVETHELFSEDSVDVVVTVDSIT